MSEMQIDTTHLPDICYTDSTQQVASILVDNSNTAHPELTHDFHSIQHSVTGRHCNDFRVQVEGRQGKRAQWVIEVA